MASRIKNALAFKGGANGLKMILGAAFVTVAGDFHIAISYLPPKNIDPHNIQIAYNALVALLEFAKDFFIVIGHTFLATGFFLYWYE